MPLITRISSLDWSDDELEETTIQCAGSSYLAYESRLLNKRTFYHNSSFHQINNSDNDDEANVDDPANGGKTKKEYDLLSLSERKLNKLTYYQVLSRSLPLHASTEEIRKAYHRACLKYHPDKTGRGEEDSVFLLVKAAFDTLCDPMKRRSYDSTVDFDDSIPKEGEGNTVETFYEVYGPVFERNLRFASFNDPAKLLNTKDNGGGGDGTTPKKKGKNKKKKGSGGGGDNKKAKANNTPPPPFGDDDTPLSQVHAFYDFWTHFDSWRDFSLKAEKETDHNLESADSRDEKRWMKSEIDRKMKKMKKDEVARVGLLVERAMAADPRLKREKNRAANEKKQKEEEKKKAQEEKAEKERLEREQMEAELAKKKAAEESQKKDAKKLKEQQKKQLRKAKQLFRKLTMAAYQAANPNDSSIGNDAVWDDLEKMNDDIELLCDKLSVMELTSLNDILGGPEAVEEGSNTTVCVSALSEVKQCATETAAGAEKASLLAIQKRNVARKEADDKAREAKAAKAPAPWTKEELSALAKAVKKYPCGGGNRWEAIATFINNLTKAAEPRTKEECVEKYNQIASAAAPPSTPAAAAPSTKAEDGGDDTPKEWTEEEDLLLQEMLKQHPASMDKNERWKLIAKGVPGKTKKECVQRFKDIREAVRKGKN